MRCPVHEDNAKRPVTARRTYTALPLWIVASLAAKIKNEYVSALPNWYSEWYKTHQKQNERHEEKR